MTEERLPQWVRDATEALANGEIKSRKTTMGSGITSYEIPTVEIKQVRGAGFWRRIMGTNRGDRKHPKR